MESNAERQEYVLNENGAIWVARRERPMLWDVGQVSNGRKNSTLFGAGPKFVSCFEQESSLFCSTEAFTPS